MTKRERDTDNNNNNKEDVSNDPKKPTLYVCEYKGYSLQNTTDDIKIDKISKNDTITPKFFFETYIARRKPCIIVDDNFAPLSCDDLVKVAGEESIQVERRQSVTEPFGQNRTRERQIVMTVKEFAEKMKKRDEGDLLYLSTQETTNNEQYPVPCNQLLQRDMIQKESSCFIGNLILHSCNLWMGQSSNSNSGLHHDYHDNFYHVHCGKKTFRLCSPDCAPYMYTHGTLERIHPNGQISYRGYETRADGVPFEMLFEEMNEDDEEEVVVGKGCDYETDSDDFPNEFPNEEDAQDDFDELVSDDEEKEDKEKEEEEDKEKEKDKQDDDSKPTEQQEDTEKRPMSFSRIVDMNDNDLSTNFPLFSKCKQVAVDLEPGEILYLPSGWFHSVTSSSSESVHMALNYWYYPPDALDHFDAPYKSDFWKKKTTKD